MGDAAVDPGRNQNLRFFCHRCNIEFEDVMQNDTCPYCASGFIERIDTNYRDTLRSLVESEYSDADMSNLDDAGGLDSALDESLDENSAFNELPPMLNDLAFLMTGTRSRPTAGLRTTPRSETLMEQLVWMIGGGRGGGAVTAGAPFVLVGAPGDYVFGGEGLDAVVTQLLGQLENTGPPPLPTEQISTIPSDLITEAQVEANMTCSVCWDSFTLGESVSRLECAHIFHPACITPWLQLHATCPICRRNLMPPAPAAPAPQTPAPASASQPASGTNTASSPSLPRQPVHRLRRRIPTADSSSSSSGGGGAVGGLWAHLASSVSSNNVGNADSSSSLNSTDTNRFMDIDFD